MITIFFIVLFILFVILSYYRIILNRSKISLTLKDKPTIANPKQYFSFNVYRHIDIDATDSKIWDIISAPGHLENFHPYCLKNHVISWQSNQHKDTIEYLNGRKYTRRFFLWQTKKGYSLIIGNKAYSVVAWRLSCLSPSKCRVSITIYPWIFYRGHKALDYLIYKFYVMPKLQEYLHGVLSGLKNYAQTDTVTAKNFTGTHSWFS